MSEKYSSGPLRTYRGRVYLSADGKNNEGWIQIRGRWWQFLRWQDHSHTDNPLRQAQNNFLDAFHKMVQSYDHVQEYSKVHDNFVKKILSRCAYSGKGPTYKDIPSPIEGEVEDRSSEYKEVMKLLSTGLHLDSKHIPRNKIATGKSTLYHIGGHPPPGQHYEGGEPDMIHAWTPTPQNNKSNKGQNRNNNRNNSNNQGSNEKNQD